MSLNVLNKRFLSLLNTLGIDVDVFRDKTFDGLFERRQNELNYFLEWFVDNITTENTLTEAETDIYDYLKACNLCLTDEELDLALTKCTPSYDDLELLDETFIETSLLGELQEINLEYKQLMNINLDLEEKYGELKKRPNHLKEECHRTKKKLEEAKDELKILNSHFSSMNEDINNFKLNNCTDVFNLSQYKQCCEEEEKIADNFSMKHLYKHTNQFLHVKSNEIKKLRTNLVISKYCSVVSKSLLEEVKCKIVRAEEFLNKVKDESDSHFTFEEVFNIWFDSNNLNTQKNLLAELDSLQSEELTQNLEKECELIWHSFLSQHYNRVLCENNMKLSKLHEFMRHIKLDVVNNLMLQKVINKAKEKERELADLINELYCSLNKNENSIANAVDTIVCRNKKSQDYFRNLNEKHALLLLCKKIISGNSQETVVSYDNCGAVKLLFENPCFYSHEFLEKLESAITSGISKVVCGPTNQVQMAPIELQWEFSKCDQVLAEKRHSIQRLLTEYVSTKEAISSTNRRQLLLWIDFLKNPKSLASTLEQLQKKSLKCFSNISDISKI